MIWYDMIWYDMIWYDMIWYDMIWYIWYDMIWYDMIWYDMIWYDMIYDIWYMICYDTLRSDNIRYMIRYVLFDLCYGMVYEIRYRMIYDMVCYIMIHYDIWYIYIIIFYTLYKNSKVLYEHRCICGPPLTETSSCSAYLYYVCQPCWETLHCWVQFCNSIASAWLWTPELPSGTLPPLMHTPRLPAVDWTDDFRPI